MEQIDKQKIVDEVKNSFFINPYRKPAKIGLGRHIFMLMFFLGSGSFIVKAGLLGNSAPLFVNLIMWILLSVTGLSVCFLSLFLLFGFLQHRRIFSAHSNTLKQMIKRSEENSSTEAEFLNQLSTMIEEHNKIQSHAV